MVFPMIEAFASGNHDTPHDFDEFVAVFVEAGREVEVGGNFGDLFGVGLFDPLTAHKDILNTGLIFTEGNEGQRRL
jgi:hypothetical protein